MWDPAAAEAQRLRPGASPPRKSSRDRVAAAFQGLWQITTRIWSQASPPMSLFQHRRMWLFSRIRWDLCLWGVLPAGEPPLPVWPEDPQTSLCSWGFTLPTRGLPGIELQNFRLCALPTYTVLMEFKSSCFSFFCSVHVFVSTYPLASCFFWGGVEAFLIPPPHPASVLFPQARTASCPHSFSLHQFPLRAVYLSSSVVQVVQIVVLILKSVF